MLAIMLSNMGTEGSTYFNLFGKPSHGVGVVVWVSVADIIFFWKKIMWETSRIRSEPWVL
jgi:hypothetical protein